MVLIRSIFTPEICTSASARVQFLQREIEDMFCFNHAYAFYTNKIVKMLMNNKFKAQSTKSKPEILPEIHVVMFQCHVL